MANELKCESVRSGKLTKVFDFRDDICIGGPVTSEIGESVDDISTIPELSQFLERYLGDGGGCFDVNGE